MFEDISILYIVGPAILLVIIFEMIYRAKTKHFNNELEQSIFHLKIKVIGVGFLLVILWLSLPLTSSLSTFGYPTDIESINTNEKILRYLQEYNRAIVRTTEVLLWTLFIVTWWLLTSVYSIIAAYNKTHK